MTETLREDPALVRRSRRWTWVGTFMLLLLVVAFPLYKAVESSRRADAVRIARRRPDLLRAAAVGDQLRGVPRHERPGRGRARAQLPGVLRGDLRRADRGHRARRRSGHGDAGMVERVRGAAHRPADRRSGRLRPLLGEDGAELPRLANAVLSRFWRPEGDPRGSRSSRRSRACSSPPARAPARRARAARSCTSPATSRAVGQRPRSSRRDTRRPISRSWSVWARPTPPTCSSTCPSPTPPRARSRSS